MFEFNLNRISRRRQITDFFFLVWSVCQILTWMDSSPFPDDMFTPFCKLVSTVLFICLLLSALTTESPLTFHLSSLELCKSSSPTFPNCTAVLKTRKPKPYDHVWLLISLVQIICISYFLLSLEQKSNQNNLRESGSILIDSFPGFN